MDEFDKSAERGKSGRLVPKRRGCFVEREPGVYLYAHWLSNYPYLVILVALIVAFIFIGIAFTKPFKLDSGGGSFIPSGDELGIRKDAVLAALDFTFFSPLVQSTLPPSFVEPQNSQSGPRLTFLYVRDEAAEKADGSGNILYTAALEEIRQFELGFQAETNYTDFCLKLGSTCYPPLSLTNYWWPPQGRGTVMANDSVAVYGSISEAALSRLVDKGFRYPTFLESNVSQAIYTFGFPLRGFNNSKNQKDEQDALYDAWIVDRIPYIDEFNKNSQHVDVLRLGQGITSRDTDVLLLSDALWAVLAIIFVIVWMVVHTMSWWLALWAMLQIILSFPVAYFFIVVPLRVGAFNTLNMLGIFILLGIGADDAFIMVDRWKQSAYQPGCVSHATRMAWAFKSAARSMFVTSFTTAISFFINASSDIPPIRVFGIFVGLLIVINYLFIITLFPAIVSIWGHYFEDACLDRKIKECTKRHPVDLGENAQEKSPKREDSIATMEAEKENVKKMRFIERFFYFKFYPFIRGIARIPILIILLAFFIGMLVMATRLQPAQEPAEFIPDDYPLARAFTLQQDAFNSTPRVSTVNLYYGVSGVDRDGTDPNDVDDIGTPIYDTLFDLSPPQNQIYLTTVCDQAKLQPTTLLDQVICPLNDLRDWLQSRGEPWPSPNITESLRAYTDFYTMNNSFVPYERQSSNFGLGIPLPKSYQTAIRFDNVTGELRMIQMIVNTTFARDLVAKDLRPFYNQWEQFMDQMNAAAPAGLNRGVQISDRWVAISTEDSLFSSSVFGLWTSILVAFAVLLALTLNFFTSLITILSIGAIVTCVIGTFVSIGWSLGIIESICLTIVVGLSVDYSAHMADSYNGSEKGTRHGRTRDMLATVGLSIFSAGITTIISAFFLFGTTIIFFFRFGVFICMTVGYSYVFALFGMPAMLSLFGPQGNEGNLLWFFRNKPEFLAKRLNIRDNYQDLDEYNATHDCCGRKVAKSTFIGKDFEEGAIEL